MTVNLLLSYLRFDRYCGALCSLSGGDWRRARGRRTSALSMWKERGLTLIEVMIALGLGLLVVAGILQILISSRQSYRLQEQSARIQESERFAADILSKSIRLAGYRGDSTQTLAQLFPADAGLGFAAGQVIMGVKGDKFDEIMVRYRGSADGSVTDCFGWRVCDYHTAVLNFHINWDSDNQIWSLRCRSTVTPGRDDSCTGCCAKDLAAKTATSTQPLIVNVENIAIFYGLDSTNPDPNSLAADTYVTRAGVPAGAWANVASVRIGLLFASDAAEGGVTSQKLPYRFPPFGPGLADDPITPADLRLRRTSTITIPLVNLIP
jgi:type IV pilus assembly protein PilW